MIDLLISITLYHWKVQLMKVAQNLCQAIKDPSERNHAAAEFTTAIQEVFEASLARVLHAMESHGIGSDAPAFFSPSQVYDLLRLVSTTSHTYTEGVDINHDLLAEHIGEKRGTPVSKKAVSQAMSQTEGTRHIKLALELIELVDTGLQVEMEEGKAVPYYKIEGKTR